MKRRKFGKVRVVERGTRRWLEGSYLVPLDLADKWPGLPERIYKTVPIEYEAQLEAWLAAAERDIRLGVWVPPQIAHNREYAARITFDEYVLQWLAGRRRNDGEKIRGSVRDKHEENIRLYLSPTFGHKMMCSITTGDVQHWWDDFTPISQGADRAKRRRNVYKTLKAIMNSAATEPLDDSGQTVIPRSPCRIRQSALPVEHDPVILEVEQLKVLHDAMSSRLALTVYIAGFMGLREGECLGLRRRDIDFAGHVLHVRRSVRTENDENGHRIVVLGEPKTSTSVRDLRIPAFLLGDFRKTVEAIPENGDSLLFPAKNGGPMAPQSLRNEFVKARRKVGLESVWFHDLRKTALTRFAAAGATNGELMALAGHSSIEVASIYQRTLETHLDVVIKKVEDEVGDVLAAAKPVANALATVPDDVRLTMLRAMKPADAAAAALSLPESIRDTTLAALFGRAS